MYTEKEKKQLKNSLEKLSKCGGNCRGCAKCHIYTSGNEKALYMAVGCDLLPSDMFGAVANYPSELHAEAVELLRFELS